MTTTATARLFGTPVRRREDPRLVTGSGQYLDDLRLPGLLHVAFVRSPHAHARLLAVKAEAARALRGVAVLTGEEARASLKPVRAALSLPVFHPSEWPLMAFDKVRYPGEVIAAVVAESRYAAEDAAELVEVEYDLLPAVVDPGLALAPDAPRLHEEMASNLAYELPFQAGDPADAFGRADVVVAGTFRTGRLAGVPMEPRGCLAAYDRLTGQLTLWSSTQTPYQIRTMVAQILGFPENRLRVIAPDVGGGFGIKSQFYPEEAIVCLLAMRLRQPVKWMSDRREDLLSSAHARDSLVRAELAATSEGELLAVRADVTIDPGAYSVWPYTAAMEAAMVVRMLPGPYKIRNYEATARAVLTNKTPVGVYRGVAQPISHLVMEGLVDSLARKLDLDPAEVRRRNLIDEFPYRSVAGPVYESGSHRLSLERALELVDYQGLRARQAELRRQGRYLGIGLCSYVELSAPGPATYKGRGMDGIPGFEVATVRFDPQGKITLLSGLSGHGQGIETMLAQLVGDELGVPLEDVVVRQGDTSVVPYGMGTVASRSAVSGGGATTMAVRKVKDKIRSIAAHFLEAAPDDLAFEDGRVVVRGSPEKGIALAEVARIAITAPYRLPPGVEPGLEATHYYEPPALTFSNGAHVAAVEVDPETGEVKLDRYLVVEDCGPMINPMLVDGQIHGAVAQGIGEALYEEVRYDEHGQLVSASLMDYLLPAATSMVDVETAHCCTPSPYTVNGVKGMGEGGTVGAVPAVANAVADALGVGVEQVPVTPERVVELIRRMTDDGRPTIDDRR